MHRFQVRTEDIADNILHVRDEEAHHLSRVLRLSEGDEILAFDPTGTEYRARITSMQSGSVTCEIISAAEVHREPPVQVYLVQGLPKGDKMELIIQKTTELGIAKIYPVRTNRSVVQLEGKKAQERVERWQKIAGEAAKQCWRTRVPEVAQIVNLKEAISGLPEGTMLLAAYEAEKSLGLAAALRDWPGGPVAIAIGPEGGFAQQEINLLKEAGALSVSLGPRILRTETAGLAALTMVLYELGDLGQTGDGPCCPTSNTNRRI